MSEPVKPPFDGWIHRSDSTRPLYAREIKLYPGWVEYRCDPGVDFLNPSQRFPGLSLMEPEISPAEKISLIRPEERPR